MERLVKALLFDNVLIASTGSAESGYVPLKAAVRAESLLVKATSVTGTADIKIEYAISEDGETWGEYDADTEIVASSVTEFATDEGLTAVSMPSVLAPYVKFRVTGVASNPADTRVTIRLLIREGC